MISQMIAKELGLQNEYVLQIARTAHHLYKTYTIPKKVGDGRREIHQPSRELKLLQSWLVDRLFSRLPIHPAATAYRKGLGIREHVSLHGGQNFLLKVDFRDFFPSISGNDVSFVLNRNAEAIRDLIETEKDLAVVSHLVCRGPRLTIGAPSSPIISNVVMFELDSACAEMSAGMQVVYSRYADDLAFSTNSPNTLQEILAQLRKYLSTLDHPKLWIHEEKTAFTSRKRRRLLTGLVLTPDRQISLGRKRKRFVRSLVHRWMQGQLTDAQLDYLKGFIAYAKSIEPRFIESLNRKYGKVL